MSEPTSRLKLIACLVAAALCVGVGYKLAPDAKTKVETQIIERTTYLTRNTDSATATDKTKTTTFPNGTTVVETDKSKAVVSEKSHASETVKTTTATSLLPNYSLGVSAVFNPRAPLEREYQIEMSKRLWKTPFSGTLTYQTNRTIAAGVRIDF